MQSKSGQAAKEMTERHNWIQDKFNFRCKGLRKFSRFKSQSQGASAPTNSAHNISRGSTYIYSMEISMQSDTTVQPIVTSLSALSQHSPVDQQVMYQFTQMKTMLAPFLGWPRQGTTRTAFCNYLASEVETLYKRNF